jgi:activator of HSP90 ATPase
MKKESFQIKETFPVKPSVIYKAWLDSKEHSEMTGGEASCSEKVGDIFTAWDGYIIGKNIRLIKDSEIVQTWRTSEFEDSDEDSELIIKLKEIPDGCELILMHNNITHGHNDYKQGWIDHYFKPMKEYFKSLYN